MLDRSIDASNNPPMNKQNLPSFVNYSRKDGKIRREEKRVVFPLLVVTIAKNAFTTRE